MERKITAANWMHWLVAFTAKCGARAGGSRAMNGLHHVNGNGNGYDRTSLRGRNCFRVGGNAGRSFCNALLESRRPDRTPTAKANPMGGKPFHCSRRLTNERQAFLGTKSKRHDFGNRTACTRLKKKEAAPLGCCDAASYFNGYPHSTARQQ